MDVAAAYSCRNTARGRSAASSTLPCVVAPSALLALLLVLAAQPVNGLARRSLHGEAAKETAVLKPDYTVYLRKDALLARIQDIVASNPGSMKMHVRWRGEAAYNISMRVVHVEVGGLASGQESASKARVLMDFGQHGREFVSSELGLRLLQALGDPEGRIRPLVGGGERADRLMQQLRRVVFKILPMENERGRAMVEGGKLCERKNGRGVDLNRNWEVDWGKKEPGYDAEEEHPGAGPFSEPESQLVRDVALSFKPHAWVNVHSGMEAMFTPWDHKAEVAKDAKESLRVLQAIKTNLFSDQCVVGSGGKSVGYLAHGTATDYMHAKLRVPLSMTWEVYGDMNASYSDCFRMFNPVGAKQLDSLLTQWLKAIMRLVELLPTHPEVARQASFAPWPASSSTTSSPSYGSSNANSPAANDDDMEPGGAGSVLVRTPWQGRQGEGWSAWALVALGAGSVGFVAAAAYRSRWLLRTGPAARGGRGSDKV